MAGSGWRNPLKYLASFTRPTSTEIGSSLDIHRPTRNDVDQVRNILRARVPYELADLILTEAQYWVRLSTERNTLLKVRANDEPQHNAKWVYMVSDPIPTVYNGERVVPNPVKSVQFSLESCDQGWGGIWENRNTFRSSYTWFEASILRPGSDDSQSGPPTWMKEAIKGPVNITTFTDYDLGFTDPRDPYKSGNRRWLVQLNAQTSDQPRRYEVVWPSISSSVAGGGVYDEKTGSGRGLEFVETLQAGDRIALVARALYPGWENRVHSANIEIAC